MLDGGAACPGCSCCVSGLLCSSCCVCPGCCVSRLLCFRLLCVSGLLCVFHPECTRTDVRRRKLIAVPACCTLSAADPSECCVCRADTVISSSRRQRFPRPDGNQDGSSEGRTWCATRWHSTTYRLLNTPTAAAATMRASFHVAICVAACLPGWACAATVAVTSEEFQDGQCSTPYMLCRTPEADAVPACVCTPQDFTGATVPYARPDVNALCWENGGGVASGQTAMAGEPMDWITNAQECNDHFGRCDPWEGDSEANGCPGSGLYQDAYWHTEYQNPRCSQGSGYHNDGHLETAFTSTFVCPRLPTCSAEQDVNTNEAELGCSDDPMDAPAPRSARSSAWSCADGTVSLRYYYQDGCTGDPMTLVAIRDEGAPYGDAPGYDERHEQFYNGFRSGDCIVGSDSESSTRVTFTMGCTPDIQLNSKASSAVGAGALPLTCVALVATFLL
eukprot:COSAG02_NODE_4458_length_5338_cov_17.424699_3_plen_447_part_00